MKSVFYSGTVLNKTGMCRQILEKIRNMKFKKFLPVEITLIFTEVRTDGHDVVESRFSQLFVKAVNE
jgi:hypothetical protein